MGIFGFACAKCWDYDCDCPKGEDVSRPSCRPQKSKTTPHVCEGDAIVKEGVSYHVVRFYEGYPVCNKVTNDFDTFEGDVLISPPYEVLISRKTI
jgi:hypothetical protein